MRKIREYERSSNEWDETAEPYRPHRWATVYYHADWMQYFVRFAEGGALLKTIYPAADLHDACTTADYFVNRFLGEDHD